MPNPAAAKWPDSMLAEMRMIGDPLADATVDAVFQRGDIDEVNSLLTALVRNDQVPPQGLDPAVYQYLETAKATAAPDPALALEAQNFFKQHGDLVLFSLVCASLPECYTMKKGINVLWLTQRLEEHALRRLLETAQFVLRVLSPGGLEPNGAGVCAAAKVRLMHAAIRRLILHKPTSTLVNPTNFSDVLLATKWDTETLGYPINQTDLTYTLLTFSYVIPRCMDRLGVEMSRQEKNAFLHCWNVVGLVMGIRPELMPSDIDEAGALFDLIKQREGGASDGGQAMTAALVTTMKNALPAHIIDFLPLLLMRELMEPTTCEWLGLPKPGLLSRIAEDILVAEVRGGALLKREVNEHLVVTPLVWNWAAGKLLNFLTNYEQPPGWNRSVFEIPEELASSWELERPEPGAV